MLRHMRCYCLFISILPLQSVLSVHVKTTEGTVIGQTATDGDYTIFYSVPYAGNVSGTNRFKTAPPPEKYAEPKAGKKTVCAQPSPSGLIGIENCLTLDIYTKSLEKGKPILVWLHGDDYSKNNHEYSYKTFAEANILVIDVHYRQSIFGFLCLNVPEAPGNAGLKDVIQALKWIRNNANNFGGNPNNVIVIGHGSGAAIADLLSLLRETKDLIHKIIVLSGSALSPWAIAYDPIGHAESFGSAILGGNKTSASNMVKSLINERPEKLVNDLNKFNNRFPNQTLLFAPCIENTNLPGSILKKAPLKLLIDGDYNHVNYIAGYVKQEGTIRIKEALQEAWLARMQNNFSQFLPVDMDLKNRDETNTTVNAIIKSYFHGKPIEKETIQNFINYEGDVLIKNPILKSVTMRAKTSEQPVRLLSFDFEEDTSTNDKWMAKDIHLTGLPHSRILDYLLDGPTNTVLSSHKAYLVKRIIAFTKTSKPTTEIGDEPGDVSWRNIVNGHFYYLSIGGPNKKTSTNEPKDDLLVDPPMIMSWDDFYGKKYKYPIGVSASIRLMASATSVLLCIMAFLYLT